ncbi:YbbM-like seven transmembrane helix protein [Oenococcus kitaharae DSM 17330]|uniref:YbbM-like seven transmembrane helix protein n=1 Tax=Oenococcus kitaharae DSM 17330 TaxID=1045004 RepID=G9WHV8_9LACO|nr:iron export ABC transporter permease subunit FetB [Oenococcus kitaharae]EHN58682.1 YbbM-like seven transmembrane helix protein [Oenococcus kitaharae DSM 17330]
MNNLNISNTTLVLVASLVVVSLLISYKQKLGIVKETAIAVLRAVVQLVVVGFVLQYIFDAKEWFLTLAMYLVIIFNAAYNAGKRASDLSRWSAFSISFVSLIVSVSITMTILVTSGAIEFKAMQVVPISGMLANNTLAALGLVYRNMHQQYNDLHEQVVERLALGASIRDASYEIYRNALRLGMQPQIDTAKTLGIVSLPGMMSGLIFAGVSLVSAIKYQIMVTFMLLGSTGISCLMATFMTYRKYFNNRAQLVGARHN